MAHRCGLPRDPFWWTLFGAGGVMAAFFLPVLLLLTGLAIPLGLVEAPTYARMHALIAHPLARVFLFVLVSLSMMHWAHRFRFTLYDGLQLKHLEGLIMLLCYGMAALVSTVIAFELLQF